MKVKSFDSVTVRKLRQEVDMAINRVLEEYGLELAPSTIRYSETSMKYPLNFFIKSDKPASENGVQLGYAPIGTAVSVRWSDGADYIGTVVKNSGRGKYVIEFEGEEGRYWRVPYANCQPA